MEHKCLKWACMTHLEALNTSYAQKKGWKSNWQFDSQPLKVRNRPDFLACRQHSTYHWRVIDKGYNFSWDLTSIRVMHTKLWASKVVGVPILEISGLPLGSPETKWHLGVGPMAMHIVYYKGGGGDFPQVWVVVSLVSPCLLVHLRCSSCALTNLLFSLCRSVQVINLLVNLHNPHLGAPTCPSTPKMLWAKERAPTPSPFTIFIFGLAIESIKEPRGASTTISDLRRFCVQRSNKP